MGAVGIEPTLPRHRATPTSFWYRDRDSNPELQVMGLTSCLCSIPSLEHHPPRFLLCTLTLPTPSERVRRRLNRYSLWFLSSLT